MNRRALAVAALASVAAAGCNLTGPWALEAGRQDYNEVVQQTSSEQLLLNLVRLRYMDPPQFLEVGSVTASYSFDSSLGIAASVPFTDGSQNGVGSATARVGWVERPTVSYQPLQGERFVTQLLSPISAETLLLLYHSGWSIERIFRVCLQHLNGLRNAPTASGPTPSLEPVFREFLQVSRILRTLQVEGHLELGLEARGEARVLVLRIGEAATGRADFTTLQGLLRLPPDARVFTLLPGVSRGEGAQVTFQTRSLMGALFYLSQGVEVPADDTADGRVVVTRTAGGGTFDWDEMLDGLFRITTESPDVGAAVRVSYRGHTFYLPDDDLSSKSTFTFLSQLFALQAGNVQTAAPVLTLSVAGG